MLALTSDEANSIHATDSANPTALLLSPVPELHVLASSAGLHGAVVTMQPVCATDMANVESRQSE